MRANRVQAWRILLTILFIVSSLAVSVAAFHPDHAHRGASPHDCAICQAGHLPFDEAPSTPQVIPVHRTIESVLIPNFPSATESYGKSSPSRAPPSRF